MKKEDFINGKTVVEVNDGKRYLFLNDIFMSTDGWFSMSSLDENLTMRTSTEKTITKAYTTEGYNLSTILEDHYLTEVWARIKYVSLPVAIRDGYIISHKDSSFNFTTDNALKYLSNMSIREPKETYTMLTSNHWIIVKPK